jgi:hypothetical protein
MTYHNAIIQTAQTYQRQGRSNLNFRYLGAKIVADLILLRHFLETQIEIWAPIVGVPYYEISTLGNLRSYIGTKGFGGRTGFKRIICGTPHAIKSFPRCAKTPYLVAAVQTPKGERQVQIHRLVAQAFLPNPSHLPQVNHKNLIKSDPRVGNLEWVTNKENHCHASRHGAKAHGEGHGMVKLTEVSVLAIRHRYANGVKMPQLATEYGVSKQSIWRIVHRKNWKYLS